MRVRTAKAFLILDLGTGKWGGNKSKLFPSDYRMHLANIVHLMDEGLFAFLQLLSGIPRWYTSI